MLILGRLLCRLGFHSFKITSLTPLNSLAIGPGLDHFQCRRSDCTVEFIDTDWH